MKSYEEQLKECIVREQMNAMHYEPLMEKINAGEYVKNGDYIDVTIHDGNTTIMARILKVKK